MVAENTAKTRSWPRRGLPAAKAAARNPSRRCCRRGPTLPSIATTLSDARPAAEAVWFAPGAADLSRLPMRSEAFEDTWHGITTGQWPNRKPAKAPGKGGNQIFIDLALERHREQEAVLDEIRQQGTQWFGGEDEDGHFVPAFTEVGRRTALAGAHVVRRIVALTEKRPLSGAGKGAVARQFRKECALLDDYVVLNSRVRSAIRVDNEMVWNSWTDVYSWLVHLLNEGTIPLIPHLAVCKRSADGKIRRPHFIILLPVGDEVRGDGRCRGEARGLMKAVEHGWIRALSGDFGGASNSRKIKSPTAPRNLVGIFNQHDFQTLNQMAETLDCSRPDYRRLAAEEAGLDLRKSNSVFDDTRERAWPMTARLCDLGDARYARWLDDEEEFANGLYAVLIDGAIMRHSGDKPVEAIERIVMAVSRRVARDWDPTQVSRPPDRGVIQLPPDMPIEEKWVLSGQRSSSMVLCHTIEEMADDIAKIEASGRAARPVDMIDEGWTKTTVSRRFDAALLLFHYRSHPVAGKKGTDPSIKTAIDPVNIPSSPFEPAIASPAIVGHRLILAARPARLLESRQPSPLTPWTPISQPESPRCRL